MKSLQMKIALLGSVALITLCIFVCGYIYFDLRDKVLTRSIDGMNTTALREKRGLDNKLIQSEISLNIIYDFALLSLDETEINDKIARKEHLKELRKVALNVVKNTNSAVVVYYRLHNKFGNKTGFYLGKKSMDSNNFIDQEMLDLAVADEKDERAKWFFEPMRNKKAMWLTPYFNEELKINVISYVIPIFKYDEFIGVLGLDMNFDAFLDSYKNMSFYKKSIARIVDIKDNKVYYRENGKTLYHLPHTGQNLELDKALESTEKTLEHQTIKHVVNGVEYEIAFDTIKNGMKYVLAVPRTSLVANVNETTKNVLLFSFVIFLIFNIITFYVASRIASPLKELNEAAKKIANGECDVDIKCKTKDEVWELTKSILNMAQKLKANMSKMNELAYKDELTKVKNKTSYIKYINELRSSDKYAVIVFDVNNLKVLNDAFGHAQGDTLIKKASSHISRVFSHSPVFRVGGDEFVAILRGDDLANMDKLLEIFERDMSKNRLDTEPFCAISIAYGVARNDENDEFERVFAKADANMYERKRKMKEKN